MTIPYPRRLTLPFALACTMGLCPSAFAADPAAQGSTHDAPDSPRESPPGSPPEPAPVARSWAYVDETSVPRAGETFLQLRGNYSHYSASPTRPFATNLATPGSTAEVGAEAGLGAHTSLAATVMGGDGFAPSARSNMGATLGIRYAPELSTPGLRVAFSAAYLRETTSANGVFLRASTTYDAGAWRFGATGVAEKVFARGRDEADVMVVLGVQREVLPQLRVGIEYVGQDLEGLIDDEEAEGGARHFLGGTLSYAFLDERFSFIAGPSAGLSGGAPTLLGRAGIVARF